MIVTAQPGIDYDAVAAALPCLLDLRGVTAPAANVVRL